MAETRKRTTAKDRAAASKAKQQGFKDANFDGVPDPDPLTRKELAAQYQSALGLIYSVPEITEIFEKAFKEQWVGPEGQAKFSAAIQNSNWYRNNNQYFREAWAAEHFGMTDGKPGADWQTRMSDARQFVQDTANEMGSQVTPEEIDSLARRTIYEGWDKAGRERLLTQALVEGIKYLPDGRGEAQLRGSAGDLADTLKSIATANGLSYSDNYYVSAAKSVASKLTSVNDWERDIREQAASMWQPYAEKIRAGANAYDLASPYINTLAQELEMSPQSITLNDPYVRQAITDGTSLWEFTKKVRSDPRWMNTRKAQNEVTGTVGRVMQMFGLMGG